MVCPEGTSTAAHAGSKVVYEIGIGEKTICVEATPDFMQGPLSMFICSLVSVSPLVPSIHQFS